MRAKTIPVFGNRRGGTSAVAGVLRILGVPMGDQIRMGSNEDARMQRAVRHGGPEGVKELVDEYNAKWDVWGWKFPKSIIRYDWIEPLLRNPMPICVYRPVDELLDANRRYDNWSGDRAVINRINGRLERFSVLEGLHIEYHDLLDDPIAVTHQIADYIEATPTEEQLTTVRTYIKPGAYRRLDGEKVGMAIRPRPVEEVDEAWPIEDEFVAS